MGILVNMLTEAFLSETPKMKILKFPKSTSKVIAKATDKGNMRSGYPTYNLNPLIKNLSKKLNDDDMMWTPFAVIEPNSEDNIFKTVDKLFRSLGELKQTLGTIEVWFVPSTYFHIFYDRSTKEWIVPAESIIIPA